jgi:hypothetical protein
MNICTKVGSSWLRVFRTEDKKTDNTFLTPLSLLFLLCRHDITEILLKVVFNTIITLLLCIGTSDQHKKNMNCLEKALQWRFLPSFVSSGRVVSKKIKNRLHPFWNSFLSRSSDQQQKHKLCIGLCNDHQVWFQLP